MKSWVHRLCIGLTCLAASARAAPSPPSFDATQEKLARGERALERGDSITAIGEFRDAVHRAPRDERGYLALGRAYLRLGEAKNAREAFETGLRHTRGSEALVLGLAHSLAALGAGKQALSTLRALWRRHALSLEGLAELARLAQDAGALSEALAARRAQLSELERTEENAAAEGARVRVQVAALSLLLGSADRLSPAHCAERSESAVALRLAGCH